jgi:streptomycin 6-kinase
MSHPADGQTLLADLVERWELELGDKLSEDDSGPWAATWAGTRAGAEPVVLRVGDPSGSFAQEVRSLLQWDGNGAVLLIDHDPRGAALLERAVPGTSLLDEPDEDRAMLLAADLLERLWIPDPEDIDTVADEVARWANTLPGRNRAEGGPIDEELIDEASALLRELASSQKETVLLHGDLHLGNVLAAQREPWLAIDPKPLVGEREFDVTALIRDKQEELVADVDAGQERVQHRFDLLSDRLACDRERLKGWSVAIMVDYALWCFETDDREWGINQVATARMLQHMRT